MPDENRIPDDLRAAMEAKARETPPQNEIQHSPQQLGQACQIDNCEFNGAADIWIAIKGDNIYSDDARDFHFNVWICRQHYEVMSSVPAEMIPPPPEVQP